LWRFNGSAETDIILKLSCVIDVTKKQKMDGREAELVVSGRIVSWWGAFGMEKSSRQVPRGIGGGVNLEMQ
jgi:hypothetical protein